MERLKNLSGGNKFVEFPPNCLQFKSLCLAFYEDLRLPKAAVAYREIKQNLYGKPRPWSHKIVKFTAARLPANFLLIEQEQEAYALFNAAYEKVCNLVRQGHEVPEIPEPTFLCRTSSKAIAQHYLQQIRQQLGA